MYSYIISIIILILIIIGIVVYFRYKASEGFQVEDMSQNYFDINKIKVVTPDIGDTSNLSPYEAALKANSVIAPLIASNPDLKGVFANDQISLIQLDKPLAPVDPIYTTAPDTRPLSDIGRQCDTAKAQVAALEASIDSYKMSNSWSQVRGINSSIENLKKHMVELGC